MLSVSVTVQTNGGFRRANARQAVRVSSGRLVARLADAVKDAADPLVPRDNEDLANSAVVAQVGDSAARLSYTAEHAIFVLGAADGSDGGGRTRPHFPPIAAIQGWADRHGIPVWALARHIEAVGTPYVPFMNDAKIEVLRDAFPQLAHETLSELRSMLLAGGN